MGHPRPGTFRYHGRQHQLAKLARMSDDDKIQLIEDARTYRRFAQELREYNALRAAAQEKGIRAALVREPSLPGEDGDELHEYAANKYSDGLADGQRHEEWAASRDHAARVQASSAE